MNDDETARLQGRLTAMSVLMDALLSTLVIKSLLNREHLGSILREAEGALRQSGQSEAAIAELTKMVDQMPNLRREAAARGRPSGGGTHG